MTKMAALFFVQMMTHTAKNTMKDQDKNVIDVDPVTVVAIILAVLFIPLILTGLFAH